MTGFKDLRFAARLGIGYGALVVALAVTALLALNGLGKLDGAAAELSERDVAALEQLVTISEDFLATDADILRHLYVEDGFLKDQDVTAKRIAAWQQEAEQALDALEPDLESAAAKATLADFRAKYEQFNAAAGSALELSRQETVDEVGARVGSRTAYAEKVRPVVESLDVVHDELEHVIAGQGAAQAEEASDTAASAKRLVLIIFGVALLAAVALAVIVTRSVSKPVSALGRRLRSLEQH